LAVDRKKLEVRSQESGVRSQKKEEEGMLE